MKAGQYQNAPSNCRRLLHPIQHPSAVITREVANTRQDSVRTESTGECLISRDFFSAMPAVAIITVMEVSVAKRKLQRSILCKMFVALAPLVKLCYRCKGICFGITLLTRALQRTRSFKHDVGFLSDG